MKCNTSDFVEALSLAKPALSLKNILPVMRSYSFTGDVVFAYNDWMAIGVNLETPFAAAIPGEALYKCVTTFRGEELQFVAEDGKIMLKNGRSKLAFETQPEDDFPLQPTELTKGTLLTLEVDRAFTEALSEAMLSIDTQYFFDVYGSVALELKEGKPLVLYSTDDQTLTRVQLPNNDCPDKGDFKLDIALLPNDFCKQYLKLYKHFFEDHNGTVTLHFTEQYLYCDFGENYGWLLVELPEADVIPYDEVFRESMPDHRPDEWGTVDDDLVALLTRAAAVHKLGVHKNATQETLYISEGPDEATAKLEQDTGSQDMSELWTGGLSPEEEVVVNPALMLRASKKLAEVHWSSGTVVVFRSGHYITHLISLG